MQVRKFEGGYGAFPPARHPIHLTLAPSILKIPLMANDHVEVVCVEALSSPFHSFADGFELIQDLGQNLPFSRGV
jgi:hypothetical protein